MPVDTAKVEGRRKVNYTSLQELLTDAERLSSGPVKALGNWSPGQIYRHLAISFNGSIDGFTMNFPWYLRVLARLLKKKLINGAMPPGYKLPPEAAKAVMPEPTSTEEGLAEFAPRLRAWSENLTAPNTRCSAVSARKSGTGSTSITRTSI